MTLEGWVKEAYEEMFPTCFTFISPENIALLSTDCMQWTKGQPPLKRYPAPPDPKGFIETQHQLIVYFTNQLIKLTDKSPVAIACFDKASPVVKKIVCHEKRYERRCKQCRAHVPDLPYGKTADSSFFDPACTNNCINDQILWYEEGPHLAESNDAPLSHIIRNDWSRFSSDSRNLFYDLYPRIVNQLLKWEPPIGKILYISGLPFCTKKVDQINFDQGFAPVARRADLFTERVILTEWSMDGEQYRTYDMEILNRVYAFEGRVNGNGVRMAARREEVPGMYNEIHEADNSIFFFSQFFGPQKHVYFINDGDAISIGLLRALEDIRGPDTVDKEHWLCLPFKSKKKKTALAAMGAAEHKFQYVNLTKMCQEASKHPQLRQVQSPVATLVFLTILSGTDFFKGEFCFGIGGKGKVNDKTGELRTYGVWDTFFENIEQYSHLVQYYPNVKDPMVERRIVLDRDLFRIFTEACYTNRFGRKKQATFSMLFKASADQKNPKKRLPSEDVIYRWSCQIDWNANYWANAVRNKYIDPFKEVDGKSYYGYERGGTITNAVATRQDPPLDEVYKRHFWKRVTAPPPQEPMQKKHKVNAMDLIRGK
jgi:hypothetical protein